MTTSYEQTERWTRIKMRRMNVEVGYVSVYEFDYEATRREAELFIFENADVEWLDFVVGNRRGEEHFKAAGLHIGPVADDNVYRSIRLFETGVLDADETKLWQSSTDMLYSPFAQEQQTGSIDFPDV